MEHFKLKGYCKKRQLYYSLWQMNTVSCEYKKEKEKYLIFIVLALAG